MEFGMMHPQSSHLEKAGFYREGLGGHICQIKWHGPLLPRPLWVVQGSVMEGALVSALQLQLRVAGSQLPWYQDTVEEDVKKLKGVSAQLFPGAG